MRPLADGTCSQSRAFWLRIFCAVLAGGSVLFLAPRPSSAQEMPTEFREEFLRQFNGSMSKFIALAEAMPEDRYSWSPGEGVLPVAQVYAHVARYNFMYPEMSMNISAPAGVRLDTLEQVARKADVVALLVRSRDHVRQLTRDIPDARLSQPHRVVRT